MNKELCVKVGRREQFESYGMYILYRFAEGWSGSEGHLF